MSAMKEIKILSSGAHGPADPGGKRLKMAKVTFDFDNSYPTNGEDLDLSAYFKEVIAVLPIPRLGYQLFYDLANKKLKAFYGDYSEAADGPLVEVVNGGDLSSLTGVELIVFGY